MLDPQNDFNSPCYDDTFRRNYFFKEYRDFGEYFLELDYWIMREAFVSRIGSPLNLDQTHYDTGGHGAKIFRGFRALPPKSLPSATNSFWTGRLKELTARNTKHAEAR